MPRPVRWSADGSICSRRSSARRCSDLRRTRRRFLPCRPVRRRDLWGPQAPAPSASAAVSPPAGTSGRPLVASVPPASRPVSLPAGLTSRPIAVSHGESGPPPGPLASTIAPPEPPAPVPPIPLPPIPPVAGLLPPLPPHPVRSAHTTSHRSEIPVVIAPPSRIWETPASRPARPGCSPDAAPRPVSPRSCSPARSRSRCGS